jgi:DNA modification methylase
MAQVANESVDLIITSPPYNLGGGHWPMGGDGRTPRPDGVGFADAMDESDYQEWQLRCLIEFHRVAKPGASLFYNHKVRNRDGEIIHPLDWLRDKRNPWLIRQEIVWDRGSTHNHASALFWPEDERIYWLTKGKPTLPDRPIGMSTVWCFHGPVVGTWHPAPFPEELPRRCLQAIGQEGIVVLDPFAGSCTTLKVALEFGYDAIGVDISREYLEKAAKENGWIGISNS